MFSSSHKKTRSVIERGFGQLKRRWHAMHGEVRMDPTTTCKLIATCAILHNIAKTMDMPDLPGMYKILEYWHLNTDNKILQSWLNERYLLTNQCDH